MKFQCAFLYVAPNCDPKTQRAVIEGTDIDMNVIGLLYLRRGRNRGKRTGGKRMHRHRAVRRIR